ncbi:Pr6Pr family membrane protein [Salipiger mangrovisoli]|uniref:Pr6Pr family membrane protein n=1 Tax=Salipiger mangrovisoli TaxID=2865933 RepID=A0ABR9X2F0_9RHOB|nr:Pr6Pr family membrane protein [Salipiger mangrovisoli]MBE9637642.1 Pr6Pr family membrane protein [Salipiger mangrovisoli]
MTQTQRHTALLIALLALGALWLQVHVGLARSPGRTVFEELWRLGRYFTILTNLMVAVSFAMIAAGHRAQPWWLAAVTLWILIVAIVYHGLLARPLEGLRWWSDMAVHTFVPIAVGLWWLALAPKDGLVPRHALWWLLWPLGYVSYALIRGEIDGRHPYFFIDPHEVGWSGVGLWCLALGVSFWLGGLGMVALGRLLSRPSPPAGDAPDGPQVR